MPEGDTKLSAERAFLNLFRQLDALAPHGATDDHIPLPMKPGTPVVLIPLTPEWHALIVEPKSQSDEGGASV